MADLDGLLRLRDWELDEKRRALGAVLEKRQSLVDLLEKLGRDLEREQEIAAGSLEAARTFPAFARTMINRREAIRERIAAVDHEVTAAEDAVREAFQELKKLQVTAERRAEAARLEELRLEQSALDEIALQKARRRR